MMSPSAALLFSSVNKQDIPPCLAGKLRGVFSDQVSSQNGSSQEPAASRGGAAHCVCDRSQGEAAARLDDILAHRSLVLCLMHVHSPMSQKSLAPSHCRRTVSGAATSSVSQGKRQELQCPGSPHTVIWL